MRGPDWPPSEDVLPRPVPTFQWRTKHSGNTIYRIALEFGVAGSRLMSRTRGAVIDHGHAARAARDHPGGGGRRIGAGLRDRPARGPRLSHNGRPGRRIRSLVHRCGHARRMNGRQLVGAVVARRPGMKVLYTSGYSDDAIVHEGPLDPGVPLLKSHTGRQIWRGRSARRSAARSPNKKARRDGSRRAPTLVLAGPGLRAPRCQAVNLKA